MAEYIEREAVINRFSFATLDCLGMEPTIRAADVVAALKAIPAADAAEVVHGTAILKEDGRAHCSQCDCPVNSHTWNYCPNCGARLDGDGE